MRIYFFFIIPGIFLLNDLEAINDNPAFLPLPKGLTSNSVTAILQDNSGFIWLGTFTGLNKYDGYSYKAYEYNLLETNTITNSRINDLKLDKDGNILIGTYGGGLNIYHPATQKFTNIFLGKGPEDLPSNNIRKLLISNNNQIFAATDNGLYQIKNGSSYIIPLGNQKNPIVNCITETSDGTIWVGTQDNGAYRIYSDNDDILSASFVNIPGKSLNIRAMDSDYKGNLWLSYYNGGFTQVILEGSEIKEFIHSSDIDEYRTLDVMPVQTIFCNINGEVWLGTENYGLVVIEPETMSYTHFENTENSVNSLPDNSVWSIYRDNSGIIWLGTYSHGAYRIDPFWNKFDQYTQENQEINSQFKNTSVTSIFPENQDNLLISTDGMKFFEYNRPKNFFRQIPGNNNVMNIEKINNEYWTSSWNGGITVYKDNLAIDQKILENQNFFRVLKIDENKIWAASWGDGIYIFSPRGVVLNHLTSYSEKNKIISSNIFTLCKTSNNKVWIGTLNGLSVISIKENENFEIENFISEAKDSTTLSSNIVLSIFQDSNENIWVGTSNGLNKYMPATNSFKRIIRFHEDKSFEIRSILEGANHNLWLGTNKGLIKFNIFSEKARLYDESDGLPFLEFRNNSARKISDSKLIFGGNGGVITFDPNRIEDNPKPPNTIITNIKIFNNPVKIGEKPTPEKAISIMKSITLSHKMNVFTLEFTAINYTRPEKNTYEYMLEGLENNWNAVGNRRSATYSNLDAGEYIFKVRSFNNDGIGDETPAMLTIIVTPPFYNTWWFRALILLVVSLLIFVIVRIRMNELHRRVVFNENLAKLEKWKRVQMEFEQDQKLMGSELDEKTQKLAEVSLQIAQKNEKLFAVHQQILDILPNASRENYKKLVQLRRSLEEDINQKENWKVLETGINLTHDNFLQRFTEKYPKITHKDLKLVAYIRMNMSNKEIASLLNITPRSVESGRYRLRKRLGINKDVNLNDFIMRF